MNRHGDWGRDAALWLGRRAGRLKSAGLGKLSGGLDYAVVSKAIARFGRRLALDASLCAQLAVIQEQLSKCRDSLRTQATTNSSGRRGLSDRGVPLPVTPAQPRHSLWL